MQLAFPAPGVYRETVVSRAPVAVVSGVPAFVGFGAAPAPVWLESAGDIALRVKPAADGYLDACLRAFFANGGRRCLGACADPAAANREQGLVAALDAVSRIEDFDLLAVPDAMALRDAGAVNTAAALRVQRAAIDAARRHRYCVVLLDAAPGASAQAVLAQRAELVLGQPEPLDVALYHPWLRDENDRALAPCGVVAGLIARTDARHGVHRSPANGVLEDVIGAEQPVDAAQQELLHPAGINCIRSFPGRGLRVWGARTLSREPEWRHLAVRRQVIAVSRWIESNLGWAAFEPSTPELWARIERSIETYLLSLWRAGALAGAKPEEAFQVRCDSSTNDRDGRDAGLLVTQVALAPSRPAEFVSVRVTLHETLHEPVSPG